MKTARFTGQQANTLARRRAGVHADRRTKRQRDRGAANRAAIREQQR